MDSAILELGLKPIRDDNPGGDSCRDEPDFEVIQLEVRKLELPDNAQPKWDLVAEKAAGLLAHKSKDVLVASYFTVAQLNKNGIEGLAAGLTVLRDFFGAHWDVIHPPTKRMRGRLAALEWLVERGRESFAKVKPAASDVEHIQTAKARLEEIEAALAEKVETPGPFLAEIRRSLETAENGLQRPEPAPVPAPAGSATPSSPAAPSAAPRQAPPQTPDEIESEADMERAFQQAKKISRKITSYLLANQPMNPLAYRLPRSLAWMNIKGLPPEADGETNIPGVQPSDLGDKLQESLEEGQYKSVLQEAESRFPTAIFWLDLHRFSAQALEGMGDAHAEGAGAIRQELAHFLKRVPGLWELKFQGGQPFADGKTKAWLREKVMADSEGAPVLPEARAAAPPGAEDEAERQALEEGRDKARGLARKKKIAEAIQLFEDGAAKAGGLKYRILWKLDAALLCMDKGHEATAMGQLEALDDELRRSTVEDWDRRLYLEVLKNLYVCQQKVISTMREPPANVVERSRDVMSRLCRLDLVTAMALNGRK
jgi:type VI secretion system protein VasJ